MPFIKRTPNKTYLRLLVQRKKMIEEKFLATGTKPVLLTERQKLLGNRSAAFPLTDHDLELLNLQLSRINSEIDRSLIHLAKN